MIRYLLGATALTLALPACAPEPVAPPSQAQAPADMAKTPAAPGPAAPSDTPSPAKTAAPSGPLPLKAGVYVAMGQSCETPANAALRIFDGKGLSGSATRDCRSTIFGIDGDNYTLDNNCEDTYNGQRSSERLTLTIRSPQAFVLQQKDTGMTYRLCPEQKLGDWVKPKA